MNHKKAVIIGAGPAGLTAAYELLHRTDIKPIVFEKTSDIGGISKTVNYKGNRIDIGGHRFFSKSQRVMDWWINLFPLQGAPAIDDLKLGRQIPLSEKPDAPDPEREDRVMLYRRRISRILFLRKFFDYPLTLRFSLFHQLGIRRTILIASSYMWIKLFPIRKERSLEDFFINRFGRQLYTTFFKDYTEKVWGVSCQQIKPEWGAQRIKGLSIIKAILHALRKPSRNNSLSQDNTETSLIEQFIYPKLGPGQLWEEVARIIVEKGGEIHTCREISELIVQDNRITGVKITDVENDTIQEMDCHYCFSSMPVRDLIASIRTDVPEQVRTISSGLAYRDYLIVGVLLTEMKRKNETSIPTLNDLPPDLWIYVQENDVKIGRIQIFNNWSPYMVSDLNHTWIGAEYFCSQQDTLWTMPDEEIASLAVDELSDIGMIDKKHVLDHCVIRMPDTYPAYFGTYDDFHVIRKFTDAIENLYLIGRNGMHHYNNQDHSMLTAMTVVDNIINQIHTKDNIWAVNTEQEHHEMK